MRRLMPISILLLALAVPASAQDAPAGYADDFLADFDRVSDKLVQLAEAIPADKYRWRPTQEVRSVSEVMIHVAGANFFLSKALGQDMPEGFGQDAEQKITAKDEVIATLKKSQEHARKALALAREDLGREVDLFGGKRTARGVLMIIAGHSHEHLGQAIAYARMAGVVPPWSAASDG